MLRKGVVSLEFILCILIILITLSLLINVNLSFKKEIQENINYRNINKEICFLKSLIIEKNNGELLDDVCKKTKSTDNPS